MLAEQKALCARLEKKNSILEQRLKASEVSRRLLLEFERALNPQPSSHLQPPPKDAAALALQALLATDAQVSLPYTVHT